MECWLRKDKILKVKNLLIYINPRKDFDDEGKVTIKIQIDNSLDLGWKREDILLVTNFNYKYNGVKSLVISNSNYCTFNHPVSKINAICCLFEKKLIKKGETYWFHDLDAFQLCEIAEAELEIGNKTDILFPVNQSLRWSAGSFFFKNSSEDIFNWTKNIVYKYEVDEEDALWILTGHGIYTYEEPVTRIKGYTSDEIPEIKNINERFKKINISYNFRVCNSHWNIRSIYKMALKPIRVVHFHLSKRELDFFMYGKNKINTVLMPERLTKIFNRHGIS